MSAAATKNAPLKIKFVLAEHGISAREIAASTTQTGGPNQGRPLAPATINSVLNHNRWPRTTRAETLQDQMEQFLLGRGVCATELVDC